MIYSEKLKDIREENGYKQYEISDFLNLNKDMYGQFEREKTIMPIKHLITLCDFYNVSLDYIFGFTDIRQYIEAHNINILKAGERLKNFRKSCGLTQKQLSDKLNIASTMISKYEKGEFLISTHALYTICKKYKISADYLLGRVDNPEYLK